MTPAPFAKARRLCAATLLAGFLVGVPVLLLSLGSPLPARWPAWSRLVTDLRIGYVPSSLPAKVALGAGWALWAFLSYETVVETRSWIRRRASRHSSALGPLQPLLSKLVAAIVLSAPVAGRGVAVAGTPVVLSSSLSVPATPEPLVPEEPAPASLVNLPVYVVQPHDTLWGIAQRHLGDPLRWSEIAALNEGRAEGSATFGDPHWIWPGWTLLLPADATGIAQTASDVALGPGPSSPVASRVAEQDVPVRSVTGSVPEGESEASSVHKHPEGRHQGSPMIPVGIGLLGAGVVVLLDRLRRVQQRRRPRGLRITLPEEDLVELERDLRAGAEPPLLSDLESSLRLLSSLQRDKAPPEEQFRLLAVRCRADRLEFVMDGECAGDPPRPFECAGIDHTWVLGRDWTMHQPPDALQRLSACEPISSALVTAGTDSAGELLVNLEHLGSMSVTGAEAAMLLQGMLVQLCTVPWAEAVDIVVVGHPNELRSLERARQVPSLAAALTVARLRADERRALLTEAGLHGAADAHRQQAFDCLDLLVVLGLPPAVEAEPDASARLAELAGDGSAGVVALLGGEARARWHIEADGGPIDLHLPDDRSTLGRGDPIEKSDVLPPRLPAGLLDGVNALIDAATDTRGTSPIVAEVPHDDGSPDPPRGGTPAEDAAEDYEVEVRVMGPVEVVGVARPFARAWALELVVYLAMHPDGATTDRWSEALWPGRLMAAPSLHSTASAARRSLGVSAAGVDHLPRAHGRLCLGPSVTSDWARLQRLAAQDTPAARRAALRLVRGRPFEGMRSPDWTILEGIVASMEAVVVDLAVRHAEACLESGDPAGAEWAARQGLLVSQYDERLFRILLRAADAAGHPAGVEAAMDQLVRLVADDVEPYDAVHPETIELYRKLSRRATARRGA
jgi:hypothetical protein